MLQIHLIRDKLTFSWSKAKVLSSFTLILLLPNVSGDLKKLQQGELYVKRHKTVWFCFSHAHVPIDANTII